MSIWAKPVKNRPLPQPHRGSPADQMKPMYGSRCTASFWNCSRVVSEPGKQVVAGGRFDRHAGADGQRFVHVEQAFDDGREVAHVVGVDSYVVQLLVERAHQRHPQFHAGMPSKKVFSKPSV